MNSPRVSVIIPAINEEDSIGNVVRDIPKDLVQDIIVVDNGSTDATVNRATDAGARVVHESKRGYGMACLTGISNLDPKTDIVVFIDGDYSDHPEEMPLLIDPILNNQVDMVIGSRMNPKCEAGALLPQAKFGNALATFLIRIFFRYRYTDLGPFRAIRFQSLKELEMVDTNFGWTVEMQIKAIRFGLKIEEVPVSYRKRIGQSKITGTFSGTIRAGYKIILTIFKYGIYSSKKA